MALQHGAIGAIKQADVLKTEFTGTAGETRIALLLLPRHLVKQLKHLLPQGNALRERLHCGSGCGFWTIPR
jgi:hypothetical protein